MYVHHAGTNNNNNITRFSPSINPYLENASTQEIGLDLVKLQEDVSAARFR